jgi:ATP-dependent DNA helicase RecG
MADVTFRRQAGLDALASVIAGGRARDVESETVDFKEEAGTVEHGGRRPIQPHHEPAAEALAIEVACLANSNDGGVLVVGVSDSLSGHDALVGTYLDHDWLKERIWSLTQPNYAGFFIEEHFERGVRLYLIVVEPALEEIRAGGKLRTRHGPRCVEISGDDARRFLEARRGYDWSAEASGLRLSHIHPRAADTAATLYAARHDARPASTRELASRMRILRDDGRDPELTRAGALLLAPFEPDIVWAQLLVTDVEGKPARHDLIGRAPLILFIEEAFRLLDDVAFPADPMVVGLTRRELRPVPQPAYREALVNAIMHRDYRLERQAIYAVATGAPSDALKVRSPGGLPPRVRVDRLLATQSSPRNEALAHALWAIGVAERQGVGIKTMYRTMLREGHDEPEITEQAGELSVLLSGGAPDVGLRAFFDDLETRDRIFEGDPSVVITIRDLLVRTPLRSERLSVIAQRTPAEALATLSRLEAAGVLERLLNGSRAFRLSETVRARLGPRVRYRRSSVRAHRDLILAYLDREPDVSRDQVIVLLGVSPANASKILRGMVEDGELDYVGAHRGRSVAYRRTSRG